MSTWMLHRATTQLTIKEQELNAMETERKAERKALTESEAKRRHAYLDIDNLSADIEAKTNELTSATERIREIQQIVAKSGSPALIKRVQSVSPYVPPAERPVAPSKEGAPTPE